MQNRIQEFIEQHKTQNSCVIDTYKNNTEKSLPDKVYANNAVGEQNRVVRDVRGTNVEQPCDS